MANALIKNLKRITQRATWSWSGFVHVWRTEGSLAQWVWANAAFAALAFLLPLSAGERGMLLMGGVIVLAAECFNTAIERIVDDIGTDRRLLAQQAKDCGSAGVAVTAIGVGVAWVCVIVGLVV